MEEDDHQPLQTIYKSLLKQCETFEIAHFDAEQSVGTASAKEKLARCHALLGEKGAQASVTGENISTTFDEMVSELKDMHEMNQHESSQWSNVQKLKRKEIGQFRGKLKKLEAEISTLKHQKCG